MWSDTLMIAERGFVLRVLAWGAGCALAGTLLLLLLTIRPRQTRLLNHFAMQTALWGMADVVLALLWWRALAPRDITGAERLDDMLWFLTGLDAGIVVTGVALVVAGWGMTRRLSLLGAGSAIIVHGLALFLLSLHVLSRIAALRIA